MDIDRLRYFIVLSKTSSVREAAELLNISQPALSKAMKKLESEIGMTLMIPNGRGIAITDEGMSFVARVEPILETLKAAVTSTTSTGETTTKVRLGTFEVFSTYFFGEFSSKHLSQAYQTTLFEYAPGKLEEAIASGDVDVGLTYIPIPHPDLTFTVVTEFAMGIYGRKDKFQKTSFTDLPFVIPVIPVSGSPSKVQGLDGWPDDKIARRVMYRVTLMESALALCRQGQAVAYLPGPIVALHNASLLPTFRLHEIDLPKRMKPQRQAVYLIQRKTSRETQFVQRLAVALRRLPA